jgi:hypothetical protein
MEKVDVAVNVNIGYGEFTHAIAEVNSKLYFLK